MRETPEEIYINCKVFEKEVPLGLCTEVDFVANGELKPEAVPELLAIMKKRSLTLADIKRLHHGCH
jgi:hypothetical protein